MRAVLSFLFGWVIGKEPTGKDFTRREADLQYRLSRLEREAEVIQRVKTREDSGG